MGELKTSPEFSPKLLRFKPLDIKRPDDKDSFSRSVAMVKKIPRNYVLRHMCEGDVCQGVLFSSAKAVSKPEVGDTRVSFQYAPAGGTVSLIGTKTKSGIGPFIAKSGRSIALASRGKVDAEELLRGPSQKTPSGRGSCAAGASFSPSLVYSSYSARSTPSRPTSASSRCWGPSWGVSWAWLCSLWRFWARSCSAIVIAAAWLYYRPVLSVAALCVGLGGLYVSSRWARAGKQPGKQA